MLGSEIRFPLQEGAKKKKEEENFQVLLFFFLLQSAGMRAFLFRVSAFEVPARS